MRHQPVNKLDPTTGEVLESYASLVDAGFDNKVFVHQLRKCLEGKIPTAGGFAWKLINLDKPSLPQ